MLCNMHLQAGLEGQLQLTAFDEDVGEVQQMDLRIERGAEQNQQQRSETHIGCMLSLCSSSLPSVVVYRYQHIIADQRKSSKSDRQHCTLHLLIHVQPSGLGLFSRNYYSNRFIQTGTCTTALPLPPPPPPSPPPHYLPPPHLQWVEHAPPPPPPPPTHTHYTTPPSTPPAGRACPCV